MNRTLLILLFFSCHLTAPLDCIAQMRSVTSFNSDWSFKKGPMSKQEVEIQHDWNEKWLEVNLPHTWNAKDMQLKHNQFYEGVGFYRKYFRLSPQHLDKEIYLKFEGVGQVAELWVNGKYQGKHKGGYSAFSFNITQDLKKNEANEIILKADNTARPDVIPINHSLFGVYGGIYRPVSLIAVPKQHLSLEDCASNGVYISQEVDKNYNAEIAVKSLLENKELIQTILRLNVQIEDAHGKTITKKNHQIELAPGATQYVNTTLKLRKPQLWNGRKAPYLYNVRVQIFKNDILIDEVNQALGVRKIDVVSGDGVYLNGEKYPMYGVCRHQDWWGIGSALLNEHHDQDLADIMEIGATTIRLAHYQQSDYFYSKCDSLGLLVWAEIPFVNRVSTEESENAKQQLRELIKQSYNHPSIYIWGLHNEVYKPHAYTAKLTSDLHRIAKELDPRRLTVAVNGYGHMEHPVNGNADIQGMNRYFGWYEKNIQDITPWGEDLAKNYPDIPLILSEYGADANTKHQTEHLGNNIEWWGDYYPETYQTKMHEIQWASICQQPYIVASYLWNMFDFAVPMWRRGGVDARNMKGLITIDRKLRKDSFYWYKANWSDEAVLYLTQRRLAHREKAKTTITVYSNKGCPTLYLNDQKITLKQGLTPVHYVSEEVELQKGSNRIATQLEFEGQQLKDEMDWFFTEERGGQNIKHYNASEHSGF